MKQKTKGVVTQIGKHADVICECGKTHSNLFVTETRAYPSANYVYVHFKALPYVCDGCKTAYKMTIKDNSIKIDENYFHLDLVVKKKVLSLQSNQTK